MNKIGDGATLYMRGDVEPYTIINSTKTGKTLVLQKDKVIKINNPCYKKMYDNVEILINQHFLKYDFQQDSNGEILKIRLLKDNTWKIVNKNIEEYQIVIGKRKYINYNE